MKLKGIIILITILLFSAIGIGIFQVRDNEKENLVEQSKNILSGFLSFEYEEGGTYGSLYYETFQGEKTLIADHILGEDIDSFVLDEESKLVFFIDENADLYMTEIGKKPKKLLGNIDRIGLKESESRRYLFCRRHDEAGLISHIVVDKHKRKAHEIKTMLNDEQLGLKHSRNSLKFEFDEETLTFCYADAAGNVYCSTSYKKPKLMSKETENEDEENQNTFYAKEETETDSYKPKEQYKISFEEKEDKTSLVIYEGDKGPQILMEDVRDYDMIKAGNEVYRGALKYSHIVGYYYSERFDVFIEFTKDKEMIVYSEQEEKGRTKFEATRKESYSGKEIELSPLDNKDFAVDVFKDIFWNDEAFLTSGSIFYAEDWSGDSALKLRDKKLLLTKLSEEEFKNQLANQKSRKEEKEKELITKKEATLFTKWYIGYVSKIPATYIEVINEDEENYVVQAQFETEDASYKNQYQVDKKHGTVAPLQEGKDDNSTENKDIMTYSIDNDMLWMIDEQGEKGRLFKVKVLDDEKKRRGEKEVKILWKKDHNIYFLVQWYDEYEEYIEADLYRYDLIERKATRLVEAFGVFDSEVEFTFEEERGTIRVKSLVVLHYIDHTRIDAITGEYLETIAQMPYIMEKESAEDDDLYDYEVISPKGKQDFYICEYNKKTKEKRLICKIDGSDYYAGYYPEPAVKVGDEIYFMDYTYYVKPGEVDRRTEDGERIPIYCKVNVKTGLVSRVKEKEYCSLLE